MNRSSTKRVGSELAGSGGPNRDFYIIDDFDSIPAGELRSIAGGTGAWIKAIVRRKFRPSQAAPSYAVEMGRLVPAKHVPKRMVKYFDALRSELQSLNFSANFEATIPAIGPYSSAVVGMSRRDGDVHFVANRVTRQVGQQLVDDGDFRFMSWLADGTTLITATESGVAPARGGVDFTAVPSDDPDAVLKKHRERMRRLPVIVLTPPELFGRVEAEYREQAKDLLRRGVIRVATAAEVTRIRMKMRV